MRQNLVYSGLIALVVSLLSMGAYTVLQQGNRKTIQIEHVAERPMLQASLNGGNSPNTVMADFTVVAEEVMDAVVHIKSTSTTNSRYDNRPSNPQYREFFEGDPFQFFFGPRGQQEQPRGNRGDSQLQIGQGSGVILSEDGYIVTNRHVIADADDLEVTLHDNRSYKARVIGTDPSTDLAVLKIKEKGLPSIALADSDQVRVGEWVLAIGNPFNLTSTVTAGIVSAKGRNINILKEQFAVESFIQTDAAINPGNSGGALVDLNGGLIGINTAIASPTGAYSGYGFAVPANIVNKVVEDLMAYGTVQRGVLGVMIRTVSGDLKREKALSVNRGVYVDSLLENSAAGSAGIQAGDVIVAIEDQTVNSSPGLQEIIARHRPGDQLSIRVNRFGKEKAFKVTLNNRAGNTELVEKDHKKVLQRLGVALEELNQEELQALNIKSGVRIKQLFAGKLRQETKIQEGFIILKVDNQKVKKVEDLISYLEEKEGGVMLEGIYEDLPGAYYYAFGM